MADHQKKSVTAGTPILMVAKSAVAPHSRTFVRALGFNGGRTIWWRATDFLLEAKAKENRRPHLTNRN